MRIVLGVVWVQKDLNGCFIVTRKKQKTASEKKQPTASELMAN